MNDRLCTEADWKLFRKRIPLWQEAYMERLIREYVEILSGEGEPSERFWELERRIKEDRRRAGVSVVMSRSKLLDNLMQLLSEGAIAEEDLEGFSEGVREAVTWRWGLPR